MLHNNVNKIIIHNNKDLLNFHILYWRIKCYALSLKAYFTLQNLQYLKFILLYYSLFNIISRFEYKTSKKLKKNEKKKNIAIH